MWWQPRSSHPRPAGTRQYPPGLLGPKKAQVLPTTGIEAAAWWRRSCYLRPRPAGTRVRCTAQTCYASFSIDLRLQRGASQLILTNKRTKLARERSLALPDGKHVQGLCYISFSVNLRLQRGASQPILTQQTHQTTSTQKESGTT